MKRPSASIILVVSASRVMRATADGGGLDFKSAPRPPGDSFVGAVSAALALGKTTGAVWVLADDIFAQRVSLNPAQIIGLTSGQLERALAFEVEPFSGIPMAEGAIGFRDEGGGAFAVVEMPRSGRDAIIKAVAGAGGKLAGIAHVVYIPTADEAVRPWLEMCATWLESGELPVIAPPAPEPSATRFFYAGAALAALAVGLVFVIAGYYSQRRKDLGTLNAAFGTATNDLTAINRRIEELGKEQATLEQGKTERDRLVVRRGAILALLQALATHRSDEIVVREIKSEGPSGLLLSGLALEADAVDELGIVLTQSLRGVGWSVQPRHKTGTNRLPNGGPWEFSLIVTHWQDARTDELLRARQPSE